MVIVEWTKPGSWIQGLEADSHIGQQIFSLEDNIIEANVALNMFEQTIAEAPARIEFEAEQEARRRLSGEVEMELVSKGIIPMDIPRADFVKHRDKRINLIDVEVRHRLWERGFLPQTHLHKPQFIFAKAFIHSLDLFRKILQDMTRDPASPNRLGEIHDRYCKAIPDLRGVRDSIQHADERFKGQQKGKRIDLKKSDEPKLSFFGGPNLVNMSMRGNQFGTTMANGDFGVVDVSVQNVEIMRDALLEIYTAFDWKGGSKLFP